MRLLVASLAVLVFSIASVMHTDSYAAQGASWDDVAGALISKENVPGDKRESWHHGNCIEEIGEVEGYDARSTYKMCVTHGTNISLAIYPRYSDGGVAFALKKNTDTVYHHVNNLFDTPAPVLSSDDTLTAVNSDGGAARLASVENVDQKLTSIPIARSATEYSIVYSVNFNQEDEITDTQGNRYYTGATVVSKNQQYAAVAVYGAGIAVVDLQSHRIKLITKEYFDYARVNAVRLAVSNDGQEVAVMDTFSAKKRIYVVDDHCGRDATFYVGTLEKPCNFIDFTADLNRVVGSIQTYYAEFDAGDNLQLYQWNEVGNSRQKVTIKPDLARLRLPYLALGDSYSSGEGDIGRTQSGGKFYLPGTDVLGSLKNKIPEEKCHISINSYPYLLRMNMGLTNDRMKSVACSGAKIRDINGAGEYKGQDNSQKVPRLMGVDGSSGLQDQALYQFTPGRIQQIDFIRRYQPKTVTLTIGGNDTGFDNKVRACILNNPATTCATDKAKAEIAQTIRQQYQPLKKLYEDIQQASPSTRVFVLGYPQFITNLGNFCSLTGAVSQEERRMMVEAVSYLNQVVKTAANNAGVTYVDIEDSLYRNGIFSDHRLCGQGEDYITGPDDYKVRAEIQELFHPNKDGHWAIYSKIHAALGGQKLNEAHVCNETIVCPISTPRTSEVPEYFRPSLSLYDYTMQAVSAVKSTFDDVKDAIVTTLQQGVQTLVELPSGMFQSTTLVHIELNSEPIDLGEFTSAGDGSLTARVAIPHDTPVGFHTLHIYGTDESGEKIDYYQDVEIRVPTVQQAVAIAKQDYRIYQGDVTGRGDVHLGSLTRSSAQEGSASQLVNQDFGVIAYGATSTDMASPQQRQSVEKTHTALGNDTKLLYLGVIVFTLVIASCAVCVYTYRYRTSNRNQ